MIRTLIFNGLTSATEFSDRHAGVRMSSTSAAGNSVIGDGTAPNVTAAGGSLFLDFDDAV